MNEWINRAEPDCGVEGSPRIAPMGVFREREDWDETLVCTLPVGHSGPHVAEDIYGQIQGSWPSEVQPMNQETPPTPQKEKDFSRIGRRSRGRTWGSTASRDVRTGDD